VRVGHTVFRIQAPVDPPTAPPRARAEPQESALERLLASDPSGSDTPRDVAGYDVLRLLGKGGMGAVYLARRRTDGLSVALKVLLAQVVVDEQAREGFRREIEVTRALRHPNIVELFDHGSSGNGFYFAMEYCAGGTAYHLVARRQGPLPLALAGRIALQALDGLAHAHDQGFVHRDLKPENLLITDAQASMVKITDFGLAKSFQQAGLSGMTATGAAAGTLSFMPKEQLTSFRLVKPVSDVWSMAASIYFLLTRQFARDFKSGVDPLQVILRGGVVPLRVRDPRIPAPVAEVIDRALEDDVRVRYASAIEFRDALARVLA
jgi:serine/threonine protein kinase